MKLELNVVRMTNEDVIATSGLCQHLNGDEHIFVKTYNASGDEQFDIYGYDPDSGKLDLVDPNDTQDLNPIGVESQGWYYWNATESKYIKCENGAEHPIGDSK